MQHLQSSTQIFSILRVPQVLDLKKSENTCRTRIGKKNDESVNHLGCLRAVTANAGASTVRAGDYHRPGQRRASLLPSEVPPVRVAVDPETDDPAARAPAGPSSGPLGCG